MAFYDTIWIIEENEEKEILVMPELYLGAWENTINWGKYGRRVGHNNRRKNGLIWWDWLTWDSNTHGVWPTASE